MSTAVAVSPSTGICPYVGLRYFTESDAQFFYGRDEHVVDLLSKLAHYRFIAVLGASASGKSSLIRAGLLPELRSGMVPQAGPKWKVVEFKPGCDPLGELSAALGVTLNLPDARSIVEEGPLGIIRAVTAAGFDSSTNLLIIADQFEEIFRFQREEATVGEGAAAEEQCQALVRRLLYAADQSSIPIYVLIVMRSDYLGECSQFADLPERMSTSLYLAPRLRRDQLEEAITAPVGDRIEGALVQLLINNAGSDPDQLPRLQHLLAEMWKRANGEQLALRHYTEAGGWDKGLENDLNRIYDSLTGPQQDACRMVFQQLSELDKGRAVRRLTSFHRLRDVAGADSELVVERFREAGIVTVRSGVVDVTHECVLRCWPKARLWIEEEAKAHDLYLQLLDRAKRKSAITRADVRDVRRLFKKGFTQPWALRYGSVADFGAVRRLIRKRKTKSAVVNGSALAIVGLILIAIAFTVQGNANSSRLEAKWARENEARMEEFRLSQLDSGDPATALYDQLLARPPRPQLQQHLESALEKNPSFESLRGHTGPVISVTWSPDGKTLASASGDNTIRLWDPASGKTLRTLIGHTGPIWSVTWSPDGKMLASAGEDKTIRLWDPASGSALRSIAGHTDFVYSVAWSPGGKLLASGSKDKTVRLWDPASGRILYKLTGHTNTVFDVAWSPDGKTLASASADQNIRLWDAASGHPGRVLQGHSDWVRSVAWSPDGKLLASAGEDGSVRLWDASTGLSRRPLTDHSDIIRKVAWSPDGKTLVSVGNDRTVRLLNATTGEVLGDFTGHANWILSVAWSPNGKTLASASADHTVRLWNTSGPVPLILRGHTNPVDLAAWSPDGKTLASASRDKTVRLWDSASGRALRTLKGHSDVVWGVFWSPDGATLASCSKDKTARLWDAATGRILHTLTGHTDSVNWLAWNSDGKTVLTQSADHTVRLWDTASGRCSRVFAQMTFAAWSPDGKMLASASDDHTVRLWESVTGQSLYTLRGHFKTLENIRWSDDGRH